MNEEVEKLSWRYRELKLSTKCLQNHHDTIDVLDHRHYLLFRDSLRSIYIFVFFFSSRRRHTRSKRDWRSDVCSSDLVERRLAEHVVEGLQRRVAAQHQRGAGPEAGENARELDGDVTAAHDRDAPRALGELEEAVGGDAELGAGNQGPARPPTGGEDEVRGLQAAPGGRDRVLIEEARPGAYQLDLVARQVRGVRLVQLEDVGVAPLLEQGPVVPGDLQPETVVRGVVQRAAQIGRVPIDLLRH